MIRLFPRLPRSVATSLAQQHSTAAIEELRRHAVLDHPALSFAPTGGVRITTDDLRDLAEGLRSLATACGYPEPRSRAASDDFDARTGRFLHEESGLSLTEACRDEVWNFIGCLLAPDVVRWRFPGKHTTPDQFLGRDRGIDSALGRCWWAAEILADEQVAGDPYHLLFTLGVDETVGFSRRVNAVVNRRVAVALARAALWVEETTELPFPRLDLSRDLMKRFLRTSTIVSFESLGSDELEASTRSMALESARALCVERGLALPQQRAERGTTKLDAAVPNPLTELISGIALSSRSASRFDGVKKWFESELELPEGSVAVKYLADAKNYRNRIGEALRHRPRVLVLLFTEGEESTVLSAVEDRVGLSPRTTVAVCARSSDSAWAVTTIGSLANAPDLAVVHEYFPRAEVHEIEHHASTDAFDTTELRQLLEEGFADLHRDSDELMDVSVSQLLQTTLEVPATAIRGKHVADAKNLGNRISEALGAGCHAVVVSVPDGITDDAVRILGAQLDGLDHFVVGAVLSKAAGDWSRPAQLVLPRQGEADEDEAGAVATDVEPTSTEVLHEPIPSEERVPYEPSALVSDHPGLAERYPKLLVRLRNVTQEEQTFASVASLESSWFLAQPGVGRKYVTELERLQAEIAGGRRQVELSSSPPGAKVEPPELPSLPDVPAHLNFKGLSHEERRAHAKLRQLLGREPTVADFLDFSAAEYANRQGLGRKTLRALEHIQNRVTDALSKATTNSFSPRGYGLLVFEQPELIDLRLAAELLLEDIQSVIDNTPDREVKIFRARVGLGEPVRTMAKIGAELGLSRERVRQLENSFMDGLRRSTRVHPNVLRVHVVDATANEIADEMAVLARRFDGNTEFVDFIEAFCSLEPGTLLGSSKYVPPASAADVNELFARYPSPMPRQTFVDLLESELGVPVADASSFVTWLVDEGRLSAEEESVQPRSLTKVQAVAHVLLEFEDGLPFQEVARQINQRGLTRTEMDETRSASYFTDSPWVYVYGPGRYRHVDYYPLDEALAEELLPRVRSLLVGWKVESANLQRVHGELGVDLEYFDLRHLVSSQGERFELYFTGASRVDTVALLPDADRVPIHETIYRLIEGADEALPLESIVGAVRSATVAKASVARLAQEGRIVSVDGGFRPTDTLLSKVESSKLLQLIDEILREPGPPVVDADVVRERANVALGVKRGRDFYVAAVRALAAKGGWNVRRTLFSRAEIPWTSLRDVVRECVESATNAEGIVELVRSKVRVTNAVVRTSVRNALGNMRS